jgi:hypothetical protein
MGCWPDHRFGTARHDHGSDAVSIARHLAAWVGLVPRQYDTIAGSILQLLPAHSQSRWKPPPCMPLSTTSGRSVVHL